MPPARLTWSTSGTRRSPTVWRSPADALSMLLGNTASHRRGRRKERRRARRGPHRRDPGGQAHARTDSIGAPVAGHAHRRRFRARRSGGAVECRVQVETRGQTGVEMEALVAVTIGLATIYDMCKAVDRGMHIGACACSRSTAASRAATWPARERPAVLHGGRGRGEARLRRPGGRDRRNAGGSTQRAAAAQARPGAGDTLLLMPAWSAARRARSASNWSP
jgi:hypothetical protein